MRVTIERITVHRDGRGSVFEPLNTDGLAAQRNVHVVLTEPGAVRGNHYHERGTEIVAGCGPMLIRLRDGDEYMDLEIAESEFVRLMIPPGIVHALKNTGRVPSVLVAFNTEVHNSAEPDVVREVLIEA
jgi:dTDP-4-dehydrorhamnose 3,5-epimerase-like enzyme